MSQPREYVPAPIPADEEDRLEAVKWSCLLDTPPEPMFDDLTALAATLFEVPTVLITVIDRHRQYFKSGVGFGLRETSRRFSFCAHALLSDAPLVVPNTFTDSRFQSNPLVLGEPYIRFYAGAPLLARGGHKLGTFCVIDRKPRYDFTPARYLELKRFATLTSHLIEQRLLERDLRNANERFVLATKASTDGIWDLDYETWEFHSSAHRNNMIGLPARDSTGRLEEWLERIHPYDYERVAEQLSGLQTSQEPSLELEFRCRHEDGSWRWLASRAFCQRSPEGSLLRLTGCTRDITAAKMVDPLSGLHNRTSLLEHLQWRIDHQSEQRRGFGLLFVDLDGFKRINDSYGHLRGDTLLVEVARRLEESILGSPGSLVSRLGGDEFVVLIDDAEAAEDVLTYVAMLEHLLSAPAECEGLQIFVSASIGIVFGGGAGYTRAEQMLEDADVAMYRAKLQGKAQNAIFSEQMRDDSRARLQLEVELRRGLRQNEFEVWYQPKVRLNNGLIKGFEALVRWRHPVRGIVSPAEFITVAEEMGFICELGRWVATQAISQLAEWRASGLVPPTATVAVNVSPRQFKDADLLPFLRLQLGELDLPAECLVVEVTESVLVEDSAASLLLLQSIVDAGIGLDLDDFGTGYSSLSYLQRFPFRSVKIDRSFVGRMSADPESVALVTAIVSLARTLNMTVIAEGVEDEEQARHLREIGCNAAQGYLFSPPRPAMEIERHLREGVRALPLETESELQFYAAPETDVSMDYQQYPVAVG